MQVTPKFSISQRIWLMYNGILNWTIPTHLTNIEIVQLYQLAKALNKRSTLVEVGSYLGASALILSKAINEHSKLYCIDTWHNNAMSEGAQNTYDAFMKNTASVKSRIIPLRAYSSEAAKTFDLMIDLLFLDGDHSYDGVKMDVDSWLPKLKDGGIIIMHDYGWAEGVIRVVNEELKPRAIKEGSLQNMYWAWIKK